MLRRRSLLLIAIVSAIALTGCAGKTTGASNVTRSGAYLNAVGSCETTCDVFFYVKFPNECSPVGCIGGGMTTQKFTVGKTKEVPFRGSVDALSPGRTYSYQVCGKEAAWANHVCVGPDGTPNTWSKFTTRS